LECWREETNIKAEKRRIIKEIELKDIIYEMGSIVRKMNEEQKKKCKIIR
jgi:hypothetical protein